MGLVFSMARDPVSFNNVLDIDIAEKFVENCYFLPLVPFQHCLRHSAKRQVFVPIPQKITAPFHILSLIFSR